MERLPFREDEVPVLRHAIEIAEELISDHYKISTSQWKHYRYDIQSLKDLKEDEITDLAFAQIRRYAFCPTERLRGSEQGDYFKICLQDHMILQAIDRDPQIRLLPLTTYIVIHELIHVVRFARFLQRFQVNEGERENEEKLVHGLTHQLLAPRKLTGLADVLQVFQDYGVMETFVFTAT
jgi:hypothetical protein